MERKETKKLLMKGFKLIRELDIKFKEETKEDEVTFKQMFGVNENDFKSRLENGDYLYPRSQTLNVIPLLKIKTDISNVSYTHDNFDSLDISCNVSKDFQLKSVRICLLGNKHNSYSAQAIDIYNGKYFGTYYDCGHKTKVPVKKHLFPILDAFYEEQLDKLSDGKPKKTSYLF